MGKLKLSEVDIVYIKDFLKFDEKDIDEEWVIWAAIANIAVLIASIYFVEQKLIGGIIFSIMIIGILVSLIWFLKKVEHSKKNFYLFFGIYASFWSISFSALSYVFSKSKFEQINALLFLTCFMMIFVVAAFTFFGIKKKISRNHYKPGGRYPILTRAGMMLAIMVSRAINVDRAILFGIVCMFFALVSASNVYFLIKYYCYVLVEKAELSK